MEEAASGTPTDLRLAHLNILQEQAPYKLIMS